MKKDVRILIKLLFLFMYANSFGQMDLTPKRKDTVVIITKDIDFIVKAKNDSIIAFLLPKGKKIAVTLKNVKIDTVRPPWYTKLSLRQSFQNKNDRSEAAYGMLVFPKDSASSQNFSFALGYNILSGRGNSSLNPFIEWQKNNLSAKKQNTFLAGLNLQFPLWKTLELDSKKNKKWTLYTIAALNYKHDSEKETEGTQASLYFTPAFRGIDKPIALLPDDFGKNGVLDYYYNVYAGIEYENRSQVSDQIYKGVTGRWHFRVSAAFYPLSEMLKKRFEIIPEFTYRNAFYNSSRIEERINNFFKLSVNLALLKKGKSSFADVKLGYEFKNGCDPTVGFDKQAINTFVLKVKI